MSTRRARFTHPLIALAVAAAGLAYGEATTVSPAGAAPVATAASVVIETSTIFATPGDPNRCVAQTFIRVNEVARATRYDVKIDYLRANHQIGTIGMLPPYPGDTFTLTGGSKAWVVTAAPGTHQVKIGGWGSTGQGCAELLEIASGHYAVVSAAAEVPDRDYVPRSPARLVDTRPGATTVDGDDAGGGVRPAGSTLEVAVTGRGGVDADAGAVALNVTATEPAGAGYVTVYPCGTEQPNASNVNFEAGVTIANSVISKIGAGGAVCIFTSQQTHLIIDANGDYPAGSSYVATAPARMLETRAGGSTADGQQLGGGPVGAGSATIVQIAGRAGVPADAAAVVLNVTVTEPASPGYISVYPCGGDPPNSSNVNYTVGLTIANMVIAKVGDNGSVCVYAQSALHLVVDVAGYFAAGSIYTALAPRRMLDSRPGQATVDGSSRGLGTRPTGTITALRIVNRAGVPANATSVLLNVTVTGTGGAGYVTVYPCGIDPPLASNLNFVAGQTIANAVITKIGTGGDVCLFNSQPTDLLADLGGYFVS